MEAIPRSPRTVHDQRGTAIDDVDARAFVCYASADHPANRWMGIDRGGFHRGHERGEKVKPAGAMNDIIEFHAALIPQDHDRRQFLSDDRDLPAILSCHCASGFPEDFNLREASAGGLYDNWNLQLVVHKVFFLSRRHLIRLVMDFNCLGGYR
ncbi:hypothetical protein QLX08_003090 [Tetragonisca angustula]|uniref:Uncharacterized protein n=1 Tax=Tetragonisca angustula TaxID=166442 RepID=A0AAW1A8U3_9HYME